MVHPSAHHSFHPPRHVLLVAFGLRKKKIIELYPQKTESSSSHAAHFCFTSDICLLDDSILGVLENGSGSGDSPGGYRAQRFVPETRAFLQFEEPICEDCIPVAHVL